MRTWAIFAYVLFLLTFSVPIQPSLASDPPSNWDTLVANDALVCSSWTNGAEAFKAVSARDVRWLNSLGCLIDPEGGAATLVERARQSTGYFAKIRLHHLDETVWVYEDQMIGINPPKQSWRVDRTLKTLNKITTHIEKCSKGFVTAAGLGSQHHMIFEVSNPYSTYLELEFVGIIYTDAIMTDRQVRAAALRAKPFLGMSKCMSLDDASVLKEVRSFGKYIELDLPLSVLPVP